ncbi:hypothetical protein [Burkholderia pseudomultivorans]|uniref:hypothetical protein n=1 Tax=Burkholderia pseudomultivorans TaxID=1207504 RepID=UPI00188F94E3|nr:hypothetical protein [Burkholderia pseudomultivorans]MBF5013072.1 hypothetical protein [Burkholderia pseudomultivorans]
MNHVVNESGWIDALPCMADVVPVGHRSSQIGAGPQYVAAVLGRFGAEPADAGEAAAVVLGYN